MEADEITRLLRRASAGEAGAIDELLPLVYAELHRVARRHLQGERRDHTLQATALVHEAYLRMFGGSPAQFPDRAHFLAFASKAMRNILIDHARSRQASKRGGDLQRVPVDGEHISMAVDSVERLISVLDLTAAIDALAAEHPSAARAIEMRYFGGMTAEETAQAVDQTVHVVQHDLRFAHAWLRRRLADSGVE